MKRGLFEKILDVVSPGSELITYEVMSRHQLDDNNNFIPDTPAIFISIKYTDDNLNLRDGTLEQELSELTSCEVILDDGLSFRKSTKKITINF
jgi:hypothetical protein